MRKDKNIKNREAVQLRLSSLSIFYTKQAIRNLTFIKIQYFLGSTGVLP